MTRKGIPGFKITVTNLTLISSIRRKVFTFQVSFSVSNVSAHFPAERTGILASILSNVLCGQVIKTTQACKRRIEPTFGKILFISVICRVVTRKGLPCIEVTVTNLTLISSIRRKVFTFQVSFSISNVSANFPAERTGILASILSNVLCGQVIKTTQAYEHKPNYKRQLQNKNHFPKQATFCDDILNYAF